jgi:hypothetical protein
VNWGTETSKYPFPFNNNRNGNEIIIIYNKYDLRPKKPSSVQSLAFLILNINKLYI